MKRTLTEQLVFDIDRALLFLPDSERYYPEQKRRQGVKRARMYLAVGPGRDPPCPALAPACPRQGQG